MAKPIGARLLAGDEVQAIDAALTGGIAQPYGARMSEPHVAAELDPRFLVTVTLDGDEWPPTATGQAELELRRVLDMIDLRGGVIRAYTIERAP